MSLEGEPRAGTNGVGPRYAAAPSPDDAGVGGLGLRQVFLILRNRWWMPCLAAALTLGAAWKLLPADEPQYQATAVVLLDDARRSLTGTLSQEADNVTSADFMATQIQLIQSRSVAGEAVDSTGFRLQTSPGLASRRVIDVSVSPEADADTFRLSFGAEDFSVTSSRRQVASQYGVPVEIDGVRFTLTGKPSSSDEAYLAVLPRERAVDRLLSGVRAVQRTTGTRGTGSGFIEISYQDPDPDRAHQVANAVTRAFRTQNFSGVQERSQRRREFIEQLLAQSEASLQEAQRELSDFRSQGRLYSSRDRLLSEQTSLMGLDVRREELVADRRMAVSLLQRVEQADVLTDQEIRTLVAAPGISSSTLVSQVFSQLVGYQTERERLIAAGRAPSHPDVERVTTLIGSMRTAFVDAVRSHIGSLDLRIAALDDMRGRSASTIQTLPQAEAEESTLLQSIEMAQRMATTLREEYQRARIAEAAEVGQVQIVDLAAFSVPRPSGRRTQKLGIALVFGLLLGSGGALLLEVQNSSIRRREDMEDLLRVPDLGVIPQIGRDPESRRRWLPARRPAARATGSDAEQLVAATGLQSVGAEAYRQLRTNLFFSQPGTRLKTLLVSSATSGEGKTTTAANLAVTFARQGMRVLLVDCDLRRPRVHHVFGVERDPGFTDLLLRRAAPAEAIRATGVERLYVLPRGTFDVEAIETLGAQRTRQLFDVLSERFDAVLIDTSPVLVAADAAVLGALADGVLLVVRAGRTSRDEARQALTQLSAVGARVVGSVLNDPDSTLERYGSYHYRYYEEYAVTE